MQTVLCSNYFMFDFPEEFVSNLKVDLKITQIISYQSGLIEGYQYQFRVKAINLGSTGLWNYSPPSGPSATMTAKTRYMKSAFKDPGMHDIEIKVDDDTNDVEVFS